MKKLAACTVFLISSLFLAAYVQGANAGGTKVGAPKGKTELASPAAPDFSLKDLSGKTRFLRDYRGKVVLLYFTTTWCPYCKKDIPGLKKLYTSMRGRSFEMLAVYVNESPARVASFASKNALPYPILVDSDAAVARNYGIRGVPAKILVRKDGTVGCWPCADVEGSIQEFLKEN